LSVGFLVFFPPLRNWKRPLRIGGEGAVADVCLKCVDPGFVALGYAKVAALGIVQGITELLPISSTAHMRVVPFLLGWRDPGSAFSAAMQMAALAAVVTYFWKDIRQIAEGSIAALAARRWHSQDLRLALGIDRHHPHCDCRRRRCALPQCLCHAGARINCYCRSLPRYVSPSRSSRDFGCSHTRY